MEKCRLCQNFEGAHKINKVLCRKILEITTIKVDDEFKNSLPNKICNECKKTLDEFQKFREHVKDIDKNLRNNALTESSKTSEKLEIEVLSSIVSEDYILEKNNEKNHSSLIICEKQDCGKTFQSTKLLKNHQTAVHEEKKLFLCVNCGKGFKTKNSLVCHEKTHLEIKSYICKICNIGFSVKSNLRSHQKKHHEGLRYYCSQCTRSFLTKCTLVRHERIHTGIKDFQCKNCSSAFYTRKELVKHQIYHQVCLNCQDVLVGKTCGFTCYNVNAALGNRFSFLNTSSPDRGLNDLTSMF